MTRPGLEPGSRVLVAGASGLVGSAVVRLLRATADVSILAPPRSELDLSDAAAVMGYFQARQPDYVVMAAARVGGILVNSKYPVEFLTDNLRLELNVLHAAHQFQVRRTVFLGSSCVYPRDADQPIREEYLLSGPLEGTNEAYAVAKIAGIQLCKAFNREFGDAFVTLMPSNLYGPLDNFDLKTSHVLPSLIRKCHEAKESGTQDIMLWGSGKALREFLYVDDLADACLFALNDEVPPDIYNVGVGRDISIADLARLVMQVVGFDGGIKFDAGKPDGTPRKLLDTSKLGALGWEARTPLHQGIQRTYDWYRRESARPGGVRGIAP